MLCFVRDSRTSALNTAMLCRPACCERDRRSPHALPFPGDAVDISWVSENETCLEDSEGRTLGRVVSRNHLGFCEARFFTVVIVDSYCSHCGHIKSRYHEHHYRMIVFDAIQDEERMKARSGSKSMLQQASIIQYGYSEDVR